MNEEQELKVKKKSFKEYLRKILLVVCVIVFLYSGYQLLTIYLDYQKIDNQNEEIRKVYTERVDTPESKGYAIIAWQELLKKNKDVVAWIEIPDTNINLPVLQGETNDTYLRHTIDKKYSIGGSIFVDSNNKEPFVDNNTIIYGHNMKNDSMFSDLNEYLDSNYVTTHPYIYMYLPNGTVSKYKIISAHKIDAYSDLYTFHIENWATYIQKVLENNTLSVEFDQTNQQPLLMLSTCATYDIDDPSRVVVHAVLQQSGMDPKTEKME